MNLSNYFKFASKRPYVGEVSDYLIFSSVIMQKLVKLKKGERVFIFSMTDCFGGWISVEMLDLAFAYMVIASQHTFQILTKRLERMPEYFRSAKEPIRKTVEDLRHQLNLPQSEFIWSIPNVWIGTTVENQKAADDRIPHLLETPAAIRFLSCEPLLECVSLSNGEQST